MATDPQEIEGRRTLAGIALARCALSALQGRDVAVNDFVFPDGGKPHVADAPDFSIAHSGDWVGCASIATGRIGFDVECERPGIEQTVRLLCTPEELRALTPQTALARWVATEAALKAQGASVRDAQKVEFHSERVSFRGEPLHRTDIPVFAAAAACIMTSLPVHSLRTEQVPLAELF